MSDIKRIIAVLKSLQFAEHMLTATRAHNANMREFLNHEQKVNPMQTNKKPVLNAVLNFAEMLQSACEASAQPEELTAEQTKEQTDLLAQLRNDLTRPKLVQTIGRGMRQPRTKITVLDYAKGPVDLDTLRRRYGIRTTTENQHPAMAEAKRIASGEGVKVIDLQELQLHVNDEPVGPVHDARMIVNPQDYSEAFEREHNPEQARIFELNRRVQDLNFRMGAAQVKLENANEENLGLRERVATLEGELSKVYDGTIPSMAKMAGREIVDICDRLELLGYGGPQHMQTTLEFVDSIVAKILSERTRTVTTVAALKNKLNVGVKDINDQLVDTMQRLDNINARLNKIK